MTPCIVVEGKQIKTRPSRWAFLAFPLIIAGIVFGENCLIGYGLIGAGVLLAFIDVIVRYRNQYKTRYPESFSSPVVTLALAAFQKQHHHINCR